MTQQKFQLDPRGKPRVMSALAVLLCLAAPTLAAWALLGRTGPTNVLLAGTAIWAVVALIEFLNWLAISLWPAEEPAKRVPTADKRVPTKTFVLVERDKDEQYERVVKCGDQIFAITITPGIYENSLPYAEKLAANLPEFCAALSLYLLGEAKKDPENAQEIRALRLDEVSFADKKPDIAEISFKTPPSNRLWGCAYRDGRFYSLNTNGVEE